MAFTVHENHHENDQRGSFSEGWDLGVLMNFHDQVTPAADVPDFKWADPDEEGLIQFLVHEKNFNHERVLSQIKKMKAAKSK
jgi:hypothetical protein